jgi:hypothetical protein
MQGEAETGQDLKIIARKYNETTIDGWRVHARLAGEERMGLRIHPPNSQGIGVRELCIKVMHNRLWECIKVNLRLIPGNIFFYCPFLITQAAASKDFLPYKLVLKAYSGATLRGKLLNLTGPGDTLSTWA